MIITIPGRPVAKARPRFARRGKFVTTYNDQQTEEGKVLFEIQKQWQRAPLAGPLAIEFGFYMPRPKGHYGTGRNAEKLKMSVPAYPVTKPDIDNLIKFYLDCMNGVVFEDDRQIVICHAIKEYLFLNMPGNYHVGGWTEVRVKNA